MKKGGECRIKPILSSFKNAQFDMLKEDDEGETGI